MKKKSYFFLVKAVGIFIVALVAMLVLTAFAPTQSPDGTIVRIPKNSSLTAVADKLADNDVIRSPFLFKVIAVLTHRQSKIVPGDYAFSEPQNILTILGRVTSGEHGLSPIKITIPEGATVEDISWILLKRIPAFDAPYFLKIAHEYEGYLFPDTYFFYSNTTAEEAFTALRKNFDTQFRELSFDISLSRRKAADIVIMASLLEREASSTTDRAVISGILWKRLDEGMPLQVDATLVYLTGDSYTSIADTQIDSPYNTYKNKGLPKGPIANPGIDALRTAAQPVKTPYYYYLSDLKGKMHYATTFEGHQANREKYLRK